MAKLTEAERRYDAERSGELYVRTAPPTLPDNPSPLLLDLVGWIDEHFASPAPELPPEVASGEMSLLRYAARWLDQQAAAQRAARQEKELADLRAQIDAETDPATRKRLICRMADQVLELSDDAPAIEISHLYHDGDDDGDLTEEPRGPLSWTDYAAGVGDARAIVSFNAEGMYPPAVYLFGRDELDLDMVERALANLQALLNDPRVQAQRTA